MSARALPSNVLSNPTFTGTQIGNTYPIAATVVAATVPADTNEDTLATIVVPANALGANGVVRIAVAFNTNNNANAKTAKIKIGGASVVVYQANIASAVYATAIVHVGNANATNSQVSMLITNTNIASTVGTATAAIDTTAAWNIVITGQKAVSGDTMILLGYTVEVIR